MSEDARGSDPRERLDAVRGKIAAIDSGILELLARRTDLAREVARLKSELDLPLRDPRVEEEVVQRMEETCRYLKLDPGLGRDLALLVIRHALDAQRLVLDRETGSRLEP